MVVVLVEFRRRSAGEPPCQGYLFRLIQDLPSRYIFFCDIAILLHDCTPQNLPPRVTSRYVLNYNETLEQIFQKHDDMHDKLTEICIYMKYKNNFI